MALQFNQLSVLVGLLSTKPSLLRIDGLLMAWEHVIWSPFKSANQTQSENQETILRNGLFALQSCPLASKLNLVELASICVRLHRPHMAAVLIQFGSDDVRQQIVEVIMVLHETCVAFTLALFVWFNSDGSRCKKPVAEGRHHRVGEFRHLSHADQVCAGQIAAIIT